jgi:outer membrane protein
MKRVLPVVLVLLQASSQGAAQRVVTLEEAVSAALLRHPSVAVSAAGVGRAEAGAREVQASLLPALSLEASLTRFQEPMVVAPLHGFDPRFPPVFDRTLGQGALTAAYSLVDLERGARVRRSDAAVAVAEAVAAHARDALIAEVVRRYGAVHTSRQQAAAHESRVTAVEQERSRARRLLEEGRVPRIALLRAEAALSAAQAELQSATSAVAVNEGELARIMVAEASLVSTSLLEEVAVRGELPTRAAAHALAANAEVQRLRAQVRYAEAGIAEADAQWWPRVHLGARYVRYGSGAGDAGGEWQAGVQLSQRVFSGGSRPAAASRARWEVRSAQAELALAELRVAEGVDRALEQVVATGARTAAWRAAVEQLDEVTRIERLALDTGAGVQTDYLSAEADLLRARAALAESLNAELLARVELARVTGELSPTWINEHVESGT